MDYNARRKEQGLQTEQAIFQAAIALTRERDFDAVSLRDICAAAGITTGAFYHHFKSKEDLLVRGFSPLDTYMEHALTGHTGDPPLRRLWLLLSTYAEFIEEQGWELVARYYQQRLFSADAMPMDPTRFTLRTILDCLRQAEAEGLAVLDCPAEWVAGFFFRHFRGTVIDWAIHRGSYRLLPELKQEYRLFSGMFRTP